jgi:endo-1,4-beta-xylanase
MLVASACTLRDQAAPIPALIGAGGTNPSWLDDPQFARVLGQQFNSLSPENELKWSFSEPQQGVFDFAPLDKLVEFAQAHGMVVKGHGLISGCCNPDWLTQLTDPAQVRAALATHFNTLMQRYHGKMDRWDVATEVLSTFGGAGVDPITGNTADERGLVENFWWNRLGPDYLAEVFQAAHAADPSAKLFLNESLVELAPTKAQELYDIVADLVDRGIPIDGVGLEMHETFGGPPAGAITNIVNSYKALGLDVAITEMDVHLTPLPDNGEYQKQAQIYGAVINEALAAGVRDISFWGFTDKHTFTWVTGAKPHIFDENYKPKPAYFAVWAALHKFGIEPPAG